MAQEATKSLTPEQKNKQKAKETGLRTPEEKNRLAANGKGGQRTPEQQAMKDQKNEAIASGKVHKRQQNHGKRTVPKRDS